MGDRNYIVVPKGTPCQCMSDEAELQREYRGFARISHYHDGWYGFDVWRDATKVWISVDIRHVMVLPVHIRFAREQLESGVVRRIEEQRLQQTILNPPRDQFGPVTATQLPIEAFSYDDYMKGFPNICWGLQWGAGLGGSETGCCLRDYARGHQFSCEAVSHAGGTPLDALVRSMSSVGALVSGREDLGFAISYTVLDQTTGLINLATLERWMAFMRSEYELKESR